DELVAGQFQINVLQVVGTRPTNRDCIQGTPPGRQQSPLVYVFGANPREKTDKKQPASRCQTCGRGRACGTGARVRCCPSSRAKMPPFVTTRSFHVPAR